MKALLLVAGIAVFDAASAAAAELPTYQLMGLSISARRTRPAVPPGCRRPRPRSSSTRARRPRPHTSRKRYVGGELCFLDQNSRAAAQRASEIFRRFPVVPRPSAQLGLARWSLMGVPAPRSELQAAAVLDFASCCSRPHRGITFFPPVFASRDVSECRNRPSNEANDL
jgi:hypothetical protein